MEQPATSPQTAPSPTPTSTCPLCDQRAGAFIPDHRGVRRHHLRNGYVCDCVGRVTVPVDGERFLRERPKPIRAAVAKEVRKMWDRGVTVHLDDATFRRLQLDAGLS